MERGGYLPVKGHLGLLLLFDNFGLVSALGRANVGESKPKRDDGVSVHKMFGRSNDPTHQLWKISKLSKMTGFTKLRRLQSSSSVFWMGVPESKRRF